MNLERGKIGKSATRTHAVNSTSLLPPFGLLLLASLIAGLFTPTPTLANSTGKKVADVCQTSQDKEFRAKYCTAAKDLKKGFVANKATSAVWAGVGVVCTVACGNKLGTPVCTGASMAGGAGESILTKKFTDSLSGDATKWAQGRNTQNAGSAPDAGVVANGGQSTKLNGEACMAAGQSVLKAFTKNSDAKQNDRGLTELRDQTKGLNTDSKTAKTGFSGEPSDEKPVRDAVTTAAKASEICADGALTSAVGTLRCAASADPSLPAYVKSEEFLKDLQKATGKSADEFFGEFDNPGRAVAEAAAVNGLSASGQEALVDSLNAMEGYINNRPSSGIKGASQSDGYANAAKSARPSADDSGYDMNEIIGGLLGGMNETPAEEANDLNSLEVGARNLATVDYELPENRKVSIFDRVQWRYGAVSARDHLEAP